MTIQALILLSRLKKVQMNEAGPTYDNPNAVLQVGNEFGFIISIENIL